MRTLLKLKKFCRNNAINNATASGFNSLAVAWLYISYFPALPEPPPALPEFPPEDEGALPLLPPDGFPVVLGQFPPC